jgi:hypothetical protein
LGIARTDNAPVLVSDFASSGTIVALATRISAVIAFGCDCEVYTFTATPRVLSSSNGFM